MRRSLSLVALGLLATSVFAQTDATTYAKTPRVQSGRLGSSASEIQELKDIMAVQQQQIHQLQKQVQSRDQALELLQEQVSRVYATASEVQQSVQSALSGEKKEGEITASEFNALQHEVTDLQAASSTTASSLSDTQKRVADLQSPLAIHYKGVTITPGGFFAAETLWRSRALLSDLSTPFSQIPFSASGQARASEFYGSGRASRISFLVQGQWGTTLLTGYTEADFLGVGVTSNNNQSNSYVLRQRENWAEATFHSGWSVMGGQMWSLVTEFRSGLDPLTWLSPQTIDRQYNVGFSYARQYAFRVIKNFNNRVWLGVSIENPQTLLTTFGNPAFAPTPCPNGSPLVSSTTSPKGFVASCPGSFNFLIGGPGNLGGLYNNQATYSSNASPDFVVKAAFEPGFGHYEIFGLGSVFRNRIYPQAAATPPSAAGAYNSSVVGGGIGANARWPFAQRRVEFGIQYLGGNGVGRYGSQLPDATIYGDGTEHLIRSYQGLVSLVFHNPKFDLNLYGGGSYAGRQASLYNGKPVGYGSPYFLNTGCGTETLPTLPNGYGPGALNNCVGNTRALFEGTAMFWYKFYNGPRGRLQAGMQYSYLTRDAWSGIGGEPEAIDNMVFTSFRYYLP